MDAQVRAISLRVAARFLADHSGDFDSEAQIQQAFLSYLLFNAQFYADGEYVPTQEILDHLHAHGFVEVTRQFVRSNIVSKLRDRGVVIASSSRGYKIPTSYVDVLGFAELVDGIVCPLLQRLKRANDIFELGTAGEINVLAEERFKKLRSMLGLESE